MTEAFTVGIALSGGGLTGIIGGLCSTHSLISRFPDFPLEDATFSTVSGGTIARGIHVNAGERLGFVDYSQDAKYRDVKTDEVGVGQTW